MDNSKRILVAPLNWGLGHATRCIPLINALLQSGFVPVIASDGLALALLQKEFPGLTSVILPSYNITYAKKGKNFKLKMIWDSPKMLKAIRREKKETKALVRSLKIGGIISDNRLGVYSKKVPCVFITHQLNVLTGNTTWMSSKVHQKIIKKFAECWIPDVAGTPNLSGKLGHLKKTNLRIKYIGPLSRFKRTNLSIVYDLMILLSGPEPQRTILENKITAQLKEYSGRVLFVRGVVEDDIKSKTEISEKLVVTTYNYMKSAELQKALEESNIILCRSGYTTIMDLAKLEKPAFFYTYPRAIRTRIFGKAPT